jgi:hypothetical protein
MIKVYSKTQKHFHCYIHHTAQMQQLKPQKKQQKEKKATHSNQKKFSSVAGIFLRYVSSISTKAQIGWEV